jgi:hypothetical protein
MAVEITSKDGTKKVTVMALDCTICGHCRCPLIPGCGAFFAVGDPYKCLVHQRCMPLFDYNDVRRDTTEGRAKSQLQINGDMEIVKNYITHDHFRTRVPPRVQDAWGRCFAQLIALASWRLEILGETDQGPLPEASGKKSSPKKIENLPPQAKANRAQKAKDAAATAASPLATNVSSTSS